MSQLQCPSCSGQLQWSASSADSVLSCSESVVSCSSAQLYPVPSCSAPAAACSAQLCCCITADGESQASQASQSDNGKLTDRRPCCACHAPCSLLPAKTRPRWTTVTVAVVMMATASDGSRLPGPRQAGRPAGLLNTYSGGSFPHPFAISSQEQLELH
jgi:hypothetical protein